MKELHLSSRFSTRSMVSIGLLATILPLAVNAQAPNNPPAGLGPAIQQAQQVPANNQPPANLSAVFADPSGQISTVQAAGSTPVNGGVFAQALGSNGRSCQTCHEPANGWGLSTATIQASFSQTGGAGPLFRLIDGAVCPTADVSSANALQSAYSLLLQQGLIRVALALPTGSDFRVSSVNDPYHCTTLTTSGSGVVSVYRRPLPTANLRFISAIQWDGREASLSQQAIDAVLIHEQASSAPSNPQVNAMVAFESANYTAQSVDNAAGALDAGGARGGPQALAASNTDLFPAFQAWASLSGTTPTAQAQLSIARGEQIFRTRPFTISNVGGLNGAGGPRALQGNCAFCHNANGARGVHFLDIGVTGANPPHLNVAKLPVFTLICSSTQTIHTVTDPARALITGQCADIGKTKIPELRGLAARAPYFHNGSAKDLPTLVDFYNDRFQIGLSANERTDLINYLSAL